MTPNQLVGVAMLRTAAIGVAGAVIAIVFAVALSPLTPIGLARLVEPNPGIAFDGVVLGLGAVILVALVPLLAALPAWRAARRLRSAPLAAKTERSIPLCSSQRAPPEQRKFIGPAARKRLLRWPTSESVSQWLLVAVSLRSTYAGPSFVVTTASMRPSSST